MAVTVIDPGPILHAQIQRYDDPDIETGLQQVGVDPDTATYRLIDVSLDELQDTRWFPGPARLGSRMVSALQAGKQVPPVVVMATDRGRGFGLIDTRHGGLAPVPRASDRDWKVAEGSLRAWPCCQSYRLDREDMPLLGHAFKGVDPPILETDTRARHEILHGRGDDNLIGAGKRCQTDARRRPGRRQTDPGCSRWMLRRSRRLQTDIEGSSG
jgi:hypothetical protein